MDRLSKPHFRQGIVALLDGDAEKEEKALTLINAYSNTKQEDVDKLVSAIKELVGPDKCSIDGAGNCLSHGTSNGHGVCPHHRAKLLIEGFETGIGARLVLSGSRN
tara:strand:- start:367 stop:684 length:318 start_codon:yes stop_codon:yes gene_type:complete